jgi:hypothetical protein
MEVVQFVRAPDKKMRALYASANNGAPKTADRLLPTSD